MAEQHDVDVLRVSRTLAIPMSELQWRFTASGGPGGQHANTANTKVELRFDVAGSPSLGPLQRARLIERIGPEIRVVVSEQRSQARNRAVAAERLRERILGALQVDRNRVATRPTRAAVRRRLNDKRRHGEVKRGRSAPPEER